MTLGSEDEIILQEFFYCYHNKYSTQKGHSYENFQMRHFYNKCFSYPSQEKTVYRFVFKMDLMDLLDFNGMVCVISNNIFSILLLLMILLSETKMLSCPYQRFPVTIVTNFCLLATLGNLAIVEPLNAINVFQEVRARSWLVVFRGLRHTPHVSCDSQLTRIFLPKASSILISCVTQMS